MSLRQELIQVAAVAVAIVEDLTYGQADVRFRVTGDDEAPLTSTSMILNDVRSERHRQDAKWGPQHHTPAEWLAILAEEVGEAARAIADSDREPILSSWDMMRWALINAESDARDFLKARFGSSESGVPLQVDG